MIAPGARLGPYEITAKLGEGGMGEVYRATDAKLKREVAIKVLPAAFTQDRERLARFEREAQFLAQLHHPNIASIFGLEDSAGVRALVMELVEGPTLAERLAAGPLALEDALSVARQIAEALEEAHEKGIVHRDLKPQNVKVTADGKVKVLDFGLAKAMDPTAAGSAPGSLAQSPTLTLGATLQGVILGTAAYMAPEQAAGGTADRRADVWAFGVVLYEMLAGRRLFEGETVSHVLAGVLKDEPDFAALPASTPRRIRELVGRCLRKKPRERLQAIGEARLAIEEVLAGRLDEPRAIAVEAPGARALRPWQIALGLAAALAAGAFVTLGVLGRRGSSLAPPRTVSELPVPDGLAVTRYGSFPALSADGSRLAMVLEDTSDSTARIWVRTLATGDMRAIAGTEGGTRPFWSPDGRSLGFALARERSLMRVEIDGGRPVALAKVAVACGASWGREAIVYCGARSEGLSSIPSSGGEPTQVTKPGNGEQHWQPNFLEDGRRFTYLSQAPSGPATIRLASADGQEDRALFAAESKAVESAGRLFFVRGSTLLARPFDGARGELAQGEAEIVAEGVDPFRGGQFALAAGLLVFNPGVRGEGTRLSVYDRAGKKVAHTDSDTFLDDLVLSPDGRQAAMMKTAGTADGGSDSVDVWLFDLERQLFSRSTFGDLDDDPVFSPDGQHLAYAHRGDLYRKPVNGPGEPKLLVDSAADIVTNDWTADGWIVYSDVDGTGEDLLAVRAEGGDAKRLTATPFREYDAQISPDGRWLAYVSDEGGDSQVYLTTWPDLAGKWRVSSESAAMPRWRGDGREIYFLGRDSRLFRATIESAASEPRIGRSQVLFPVRFQGSYTARTPRWAVSRDGERFLVLESPDTQVARATPFVLVTQPWSRPQGPP